MLRITAADYDLLLQVRDLLSECRDEMPSHHFDTIDSFVEYVDNLEIRKEQDLVKHRDALKKWRESPTGKEKNRAMNTRNMRTYRAKKKAEMQRLTEEDNKQDL